MGIKKKKLFATGLGEVRDSPWRASCSPCPLRPAPLPPNTPPLNPFASSFASPLSLHTAQWELCQDTVQRAETEEDTHEHPFLVRTSRAVPSTHPSHFGVTLLVLTEQRQKVTQVLEVWVCLSKASVHLLKGTSLGVSGVIGELRAPHQSFCLFLNLLVRRGIVWQDLSTSSRDDGTHKMSPGQMQPNFVGHNTHPSSPQIPACLCLTSPFVP